MINQFFDEDLRFLIISVGNKQPLSGQTWVYGDNYNINVYLVRAGDYQTLNPGDSVTILLYLPGSTPPATNLCVPGTPTVYTDSDGNQYY